MIDLHSHILPGIDDGSPDLETSLEMARIAVADGTATLACTPHIQPGVYDNSTATIQPAINTLQQALNDADIPLKLVIGADVHVSPDLPARLTAGHIPSLAGSRYFLFEPPHHVCPPHLDRLAAALLKQGYVPILTHPERLTWLERNYTIVEQLNDMGVAIQITAQAITGGFGKRAQYWSERMLDEGRVAIIASDAHSPRHRPPGLSAARDVVAMRLDETSASRMVQGNPALILANQPLPTKLKPPEKPLKQTPKIGILGWINRLAT